MSENEKEQCPYCLEWYESIESHPDWECDLNVSEHSAEINES